MRNRCPFHENLVDHATMDLVLVGEEEKWFEAVVVKTRALERFDAQENIATIGEEEDLLGCSLRLRRENKVGD